VENAEVTNKNSAYNLLLEEAIKEYVATSPNNDFPGLCDTRIWDEPVVGFADGYDPLIAEFKTLIGEFHYSPRDVLQDYIDSTGWRDKHDLTHVSVISWILPIAAATRESNRREEAVHSPMWNTTRVQGHEFILRLSRHVACLIEGMGYIGVVPELCAWWNTVDLPNGLASNWSQRHYAYAAGLGTFSLNDGFITPKGIAVRVGSVVCNLPLEASPRLYAGVYANCLYYVEGSCSACMERCPAGAISEKGHDKLTCSEYLESMRDRLKEMGRDTDYGSIVHGCGLCQTKVPCETRIPLRKPRLR
jgi:epoxyqueuosine reductase